MWSVLWVISPATVLERRCCDSSRFSLLLYVWRRVKISTHSFVFFCDGDKMCDDFWVMIFGMGIKCVHTAYTLFFLLLHVERELPLLSKPGKQCCCSLGPCLCSKAVNPPQNVKNHG